MGRTPFCSSDGLMKGAWTAEEDQKLISYIQKHGERGWRFLPQKAGNSLGFLLICPCLIFFFYVHVGIWGLQVFKDVGRAVD